MLSTNFADPWILIAVIQEHVAPIRHEIREERITREIHTHDVYHRVLPVIETEVLPAKHYIPSKDGRSLIEIPESAVAQHTINKNYNQNWHIAPGPSADVANRSSSDSFDSPVIGMVRGEPKFARSRGDSLKSASDSKTTRRRGDSLLSTKSTFSAKEAAKEILHPILSSKRESIAKEGHTKTEYVWRHPPVFETANGDTVPAILPAAFEGERYYNSDDEDTDGAEFGAERAEGELLFRDSGYGSGGQLPGLQQPNPAVIHSTPRSIVGRVVDEGESRGNERETKGEATSYLQRMKEKRKSLTASQKGKGVDGLETGVRNMSVKQ